MKIAVVNMCVSDFQPGVCNATLLRIVPSEEVSKAFWVQGEMSARLHCYSCRTACVFCSSSMSVSGLEPELQEKIRANHLGVERVYFNKGL